MGHGYKHGSGGGTSLNFKVVGGLTRPTNPPEKTIWVNTATPITSYIFSATEPSSAEEGMVWISVGTASNVAFSATKKNPIMVYPLYAKQYVSGAFESVSAMSYQEGWKEWSRYLVSASGLAPELGEMIVRGESGVSMSITNRSGGGITIKRTSGNAGFVSAFSENKFNVSEFKTMRIKTGNVNYGEQIYIGLHNSNTTVQNENTYSRVMRIVAGTENKLDISDLSGGYYLAFGFSAAGYTQEAEILEITLEY